MSRIIVITGSDTGVGKTVLTALLTMHLRHQRVRVAALKPVSSGSRADARMLRVALDRALPLNTINPWHFRAHVAPLLAARREHKRVQLAEVVSHVRRVAEQFEVVLVEGAGGLLSPLGEGFDTRDLIVSLQARAILAVLNRIGAVNQARLAIEAMPRALRDAIPVVLMGPPRADAATRSNAQLLGEFLAPHCVHLLPQLRSVDSKAASSASVQPVLRAILHGCRTRR